MELGVILATPNRPGGVVMEEKDEKYEMRTMRLKVKVDVLRWKRLPAWERAI